MDWNDLTIQLWDLLIVVSYFMLIVVEMRPTITTCGHNLIRYLFACKCMSCDDVLTCRQGQSSINFQMYNGTWVSSRSPRKLKAQQ